MKSRFRLGVDIGGTFTDGVVIDESTGQIHIEKVPTTPHDRSEGFIQVADQLTRGLSIDPALVAYVIHATTAATNAVVERQGANVGLLVTAGFRDILEIGRQVRHELYNLQTDKPLPLVPRRWCYEIPERLDHSGAVLQAVDRDAVEVAAKRLLEQGVDSVAICFLHSYRNPDHEIEAEQIVREIHPQANVSRSSSIAPEIREYWRASTTIVNSYISAMVRSYLEKVEQRLIGRGISAPLLMMQSNGGVVSAGVAKELPVHLLESGPAAGVNAAAYIANLIHLPSVISFDMGGTTAKMGLILDGQPKVISEFEVGSAFGSGTGFKKGSGYPVLGSVLDLVEVGAGGGSIAWIDSGGALRVGPRSAGADPGPVCYLRGGIVPTVTDANLVAGRLNPSYFLGGRLPLDLPAAREALDEHCARPLRMSTIEAAAGVIDVANSTMMQAIRLVTVQRGYDPKDFSLIAFGGAGPLHATALARDLGIPLVVVPPSPGVTSAMGMLVTDLRRDYRRTHLQPLTQLDHASLETILRGFVSDAQHAMERDGVIADAVTLEPYVDLRYVGQSWKLRLKLPSDRMNGGWSSLNQAFDEEYFKTYGYAVPDEPVELVNVGLAATGIIPKPRWKEVPKGGREPTSPKALRAVFFAESVGFVNTPIYDRYSLREGNRIAGPAIVEEIDSTVVLSPGDEAEVGPFGILLVTRPSKLRE